MPTTSISNSFFPVSQNGLILRLPYYTSHSVDDYNADIKLLVISIHGSGEPIANDYLNHVQLAAAAEGGNAIQNTLIVAPQIVGFEHLELYFRASNVPQDVMYGEHDMSSSRFNGGVVGNSSISFLLQSIR